MAVIQQRVSTTLYVHHYCYKKHKNLIRSEMDTDRYHCNKAQALFEFG